MKRVNTSYVCDRLQTLQRHRVAVLKSRIGVTNRLASTIAVSLGYYNGLDEDERKATFMKCREMIDQFMKGETVKEIKPILPLVKNTCEAIKGFDQYLKEIEAKAVGELKQLPAYAWVGEPDRRGIGPGLLAQVIGETGDLNGYENPAKVWRRMGCAPYRKDDRNLMGKTWRIPKWRGGDGLTANEWEDYGYCPRRRSLSYLLGVQIVKQNGDGPYRMRYDEVKEIAAEKHEDWPKSRIHSHAMLLATKRFLLDLWVFWTTN